MTHQESRTIRTVRLRTAAAVTVAAVVLIVLASLTTGSYIFYRQAKLDRSSDCEFFQSISAALATNTPPAQTDTGRGFDKKFARIGAAADVKAAKLGCDMPAVTGAP